VLPKLPFLEKRRENEMVDGKNDDEIIMVDIYFC